MHTRSKLLLAALTSALALGTIVSAASANRLSQNEQNFRVTYSPLKFVPSFGSTIRCPVTFEGSFHSRTIAKVGGALIGYVNRVSVGICEAGKAIANGATLPWHLQYAGFTGTLPNIGSVSQHLIRPSFELGGESFGLPGLCRYTTPAESLTHTREPRGVLTEEIPGTEATASETAGCPSVRWEGIGAVKTPAGGNIVLSLI